MYTWNQQGGICSFGARWHGHFYCGLLFGVLGDKFLVTASIYTGVATSPVPASQRGLFHGTFVYLRQ